MVFYILYTGNNAMPQIRKKKRPLSITERSARITAVTTILVALCGVTGAIISSMLTSPSLSSRFFNITPISTTQPQDVSNLQSEIVSLQDEVKLLRQQLDSISQVPTNSATASELVEIKNSLEGLDSRIGVIEQAVLDNPEKALSITLLRKDMQLLQEKYDANTEGIRDENNRVSSLNQSLIILVMTSMIGLVGLAVANLFQIRRQEKNEADLDAETVKHPANFTNRRAPSSPSNEEQVRISNDDKLSEVQNLYDENMESEEEPNSSNIESG
jgi:hypothetical protein